MRDNTAARDIDLRNLDLIIDMRPTGPAPAPLDPYADEGGTRWKALALFAASVVLGALILAGRTIARRPLATLLALAFIWGAGMVGANLLRQEKPHPSPLFARGDTAPETTASLPPRAADPIARIAAQGQTVTAAPSAIAPQPQASAPAVRERRDVVREVQQELARHGLYDGMVDGVAGPRTERAIRTFEARARLQPTGQASDELLRHLRAMPVVAATRTTPAQPASVVAPAAPPQRPVQRTERSEQETTRLVQRRLADMGYAPGPIDGQVTPIFRRAVERFQRDNDLSPTGTVDRAFLDRLAVVTGPLS
jgi:peptidoglycan hydrolase-like protein with peptidoglycan-binding domain